MSSPNQETEEPSSSTGGIDTDACGNNGKTASQESPRPPAKRRLSSTVIEISDTDSDDSDVCAVNSYQASADEVKRIRGADYSSSSSSSSDYSSDSEPQWEDDSIVLPDDKGHLKPARVQLNPRANRMDDPKLNPALKSEELIGRLQEHWREQKDYSERQATLTCDPYRVCLLHDVLANSEIINNIVDDMNTLDWSRKKMDLYEFHQTVDLANLTWQRSIRGIYELLRTEIMSWVSSVTGLELSSVSASCSLYGPGDHLLVHDDLLADRRVAFILYLAPWSPPHPARTTRALENGAGADHTDTNVGGACSGWSEHMGGALELLAGDEAGAGRVARRVYPRNNMLAFFQVGTETFHQVGEVLSLELPRLSINGWFHGPGAEPAPEPAPAEAPIPQRPHNEVVLMNQWLESTYMSPRARAQVQAQMERESEVCLQRVLLPHRCQELLQALAAAEVEWEAVGPIQQRRYRRLVSAALPKEHPARALLQLLASSAFARLLADCTDLTVATYERLELQCWSPGDFTLLPSREHYQQARLEAVLYLGVPARTLCGGATVYVAPEEGGEGGEGGEGAPPEGALVTLAPEDNSLNLVYCDAGAASFTKYLSKMTMRDDEHFYIVTCTYKE